MPRLFHRPPKYRLHKSTKQAVVSFFGETVYLGPFGSPKSHERYQELLAEWQKRRLHPKTSETNGSTNDIDIDIDKVVAGVTAESLRQKKKVGSPITISELILVYRRHTHEYYRKRGEVTREAGMIDEVLRFLRKHHGMNVVADFGPVALEQLRQLMIDELDWSPLTSKARSRDSTWILALSKSISAAVNFQSLFRSPTTESAAMVSAAATAESAILR